MYINVFTVSMVAAQESFHLPYCDIFHSSISKFGAATTRMSWDMNHRSLAMQGRFLCKARDAKDAQWLGAQHQRFGWRLVTSLAGEIHREWGFKAMHLQVLVTLGDGEWCYFDGREHPSKTLRSPPWGGKSDFTYDWNMNDNEHFFL